MVLLVEEEDEESRRRCLINGPSIVGDTSGRGPTIVSDSIGADRFSMMYAINLLGFEVYNVATCVNYLFILNDLV